LNGRRCPSEVSDDQTLAVKGYEGYTLLLDMPGWEFAAFAALQRQGRPTVIA
jgi:hypothetical protein